MQSLGVPKLGTPTHSKRRLPKVRRGTCLPLHGSQILHPHYMRPWLMQRLLWELSVTPLSWSETQKVCKKQGTAHMWLFSDDAKHALLGIKFHSQHRGLRQATYWGAFHREIQHHLIHLNSLNTKIFNANIWRSQSITRVKQWQFK